MDQNCVPERVSVVGAGRLGSALVEALRCAGLEVSGPSGRGETPAPADALLLCVPDSEIAAAAQTASRRAPYMGHTSGAPPLAALDGTAATPFGLHPLQSFAGGEASDRFHGAGCAVAGATPMSAAEDAARAAGIEPGEARALLAPLVRSTVENWVAMGPGRALTGPLARGDEETVAAQRAALEEGAPQLLALFDSLADHTRALASRKALA